VAVLIRLDRDSVAAGDDVESHEEIREVDGRRPLERLVADLIWNGYIPSTQGGWSCWVLRRTRRGEPLGLCQPPLDSAW